MKYAYERTLGTRRILGTDHPVHAVVYKAGRKWISTTIVNGIAENSQECRTKGEAVAHAEAKGHDLQ